MFLLSLFLMQSPPIYNTAYLCISSIQLLEVILRSKPQLFFLVTLKC